MGRDKSGADWRQSGDRCDDISATVGDAFIIQRVQRAVVSRTYFDGCEIYVREGEKDESDQPIYDVGGYNMEWSGHNISARSSSSRRPLFLSSEPPRSIPIPCRLSNSAYSALPSRSAFSSFLSFVSHKISGNNKICRSPTRWHGFVIHPFPPLNPAAHHLQGAFGLVWCVSIRLFPLIPLMPSPVPQKINSQAHPLLSRRS